MIRCLAHACFYVKDIDLAFEFYCQKLGLPLAFEFKNDGGERYGFFVHVGERSFLEFFKGDYEPSSMPSFRHVCLEVNDLEKLMATVGPKGLEFSSVTVGKDGARSSWTEDPDGNRIEFHEYTQGAAQLEHM